MPMVGDLDSLIQPLKQLCDIDDPTKHLSVLPLDGDPQDPAHLIEWLKTHEAPLGLVFVHQPLWSLDALKQFRKGCEGLVGHLFMTHQILPESQDEGGYYEHCISEMAQEPQYRFFNVRDEEDHE